MGSGLGRWAEREREREELLLELLEELLEVCWRRPRFRGGLGGRRARL